MRVFVAGGTGVIGRRLVPLLVAAGHQVTATTTGQAKLGLLERLGADAVVMDGRLRTEGTDHLLAAAEATGVSHFVAQSYAGWNGIRTGGWVKTEEDPLDSLAGTSAHAVMQAIRHVADVVAKAGGAVLRYGGLYGPAPPTTRSNSCASDSSRSSGAGPATARGCISTTRRARPSWRWSTRQPGSPAHGLTAGCHRGPACGDTRCAVSVGAATVPP